MGRTGLNETQAREAGYDTVMSLVPSNEHATYYPGSREIIVKLVADKASGKLLGGQVIGMGEAAKRIDVLATALTFGASVEDPTNIDLAYAPPYNSSLDPLHNAANVIRNKQSGLARTLTPAEVKQKLDNGEDFVLLVTFGPGARLDFHTHTFEQILYVTEGKGILATQSEEHTVTPGTTVFISPGEIHWHGATADSSFSHIAIQKPGIKLAE